MVNGEWTSACDMRIGNKLSVLATKKCDYCGEWMPHFASRYCSPSCSSKAIAKRQWSSEDHRRSMSKKHKIIMKKKYADGTIDRNKITENANKATREMVKRGTHPFQDPAVQLKASKELGRRNYGKTWLEERFGWMLEQSGIETSPQFAIKHGEDVLNRDRYYFVDFAIPEHKIAIECDGAYWHKDKKRDKIRQDRIEELGWTMLRFPEERIDGDLFACGREVSRVLKNHSGEYRFVDCEVKRLRRWIPKKAKTLYNLEVEEDNSYLAKGIVVHNCQCAWGPVV